MPLADTAYLVIHRHGTALVEQPFSMSRDRRSQVSSSCSGDASSRFHFTPTCPKNATDWPQVEAMATVAWSWSLM